MRRGDSDDRGVELMSEFAVEYNLSTSTVDVCFTREASLSIDMAVAHHKLRKAFEPDIRWTSSAIVDAADGPKSMESNRFYKLYGCNS